MPDTSSQAYRFAILLGLLVSVFIGGAYIHDFVRVLGDPDTFWHVKLGSDIISTGHFHHRQLFIHLCRPTICF